MFGKMMNNYYYGKSGKGDFKKDDLPTNRWQLFWDMLKTRLSGLVRLNLLYFLVWIPTVVVLILGYSTFMDSFIYPATQSSVDENGQTVYSEVLDEEGNPVMKWQAAGYTESQIPALMNSVVLHYLLWLIPCIAITGPATAGVSYVTRNWSRDEHAFIWSDFKDALKENWKQSLVVSIITGLVPMLAYVCWTFYGEMAKTQTIMFIPQVLTMMLVIMWYLSVTYMHPLTVSYELKTKGVLKNGLLLGIARLPMSVGIRLLHCLPTVLIVLIGGFVIGLDLYLLPMIILVYYALIGFSLSRFVTASYTNAVFDRFINSKIEGAVVNRGLRQEEEDDEDGEDDGDESETGEK